MGETMLPPAEAPICAQTHSEWRGLNDLRKDFHATHYPSERNCLWACVFLLLSKSSFAEWQKCSQNKQTAQRRQVLAHFALQPPAPLLGVGDLIARLKFQAPGGHAAFRWGAWPCQGKKKKG